jgi:hypothetical protein
MGGAAPSEDVPVVAYEPRNVSRAPRGLKSPRYCGGCASFHDESPHLLAARLSFPPGGEEGTHFTAHWPWFPIVNPTLLCALCALCGEPAPDPLAS